MDISFNTSQGKFNYRVAGVCIHDGYVLLHRADKDDFWAFPGGRVTMMENSETALKREIFEEIQVDVQIERLLWVVETFFQHDNQAFHEMGFYYLIHLQDSNNCFFEKEKIFYGKEEGQSYKLIYKWFSIEGIKDVLLYPTFTRYELNDLKSNIKHVIVNE